MTTTPIEQLARQALSIMVLDLLYTNSPWHGHAPIRHQMLWSLIKDVLGEERMREDILRLTEYNENPLVNPVPTPGEEAQRI